MAEDLSRYRLQLRRFLIARGVEIDAADTLRCPNSGVHNDAHPSAHVYDDSGNVYCPVCATSWDVFDVAGLMDGLSDFPAKLEAVKRTLGEVIEAPAETKPRKRETIQWKALPRERAKAVYKKSEIMRMAEFMKLGDVHIAASWPCVDEEGNIELVAVRFEGGKRGKQVITFFYDGKRLRVKGYPIRLFGRPELSERPGLPVVIHEGEKCRDIASKALPGFVHVTWNGGGKKAQFVDWSPLRGRDVIIYPDDDEPGRKTAKYINETIAPLVNDQRIVEPLPAARELKARGADIVEALEAAGSEAVAEYLASGPELLEGDREAARGDEAGPRSDSGRSHRSSVPGGEASNLPFRPLGVADDGRAYFLDRAGRLQSQRLTSLTKGFLQVLAPQPWWLSNYGYKYRVQWDDASDAVIEISSRIDFDPDIVRGRGAWRERDGRTCYHDGVETIGDPDPGRLYLRKTRHDIGLCEAPAPLEIRRAMLEATGKMSFATQADAIRCLAWSVLAPFAGALPWRPAAFITGESESGKTSVLNYVVRPLSGAETASGAETTAAGIRQRYRHDTAGIIVEEAEDDTEKKKTNRDEILSLVRQSTSDDTPKAWKGTQDGTGMDFQLKCMFFLAAISPIVDAAADRNRIFAVNMGKKTGDWKDIKTALVDAFTEPKCRSVRSFTWARLPEIIDDADRVSDAVMEVSGHSTRYAYLEAILFSAYWIVFKDRKADDAELTEWLGKLYEQTPPESQQSEPEEMVERLLGEVVPLFGAYSKRFSLGQILYTIRFRTDGEQNFVDHELGPYQKTALQYGLYIDTENRLAIMRNWPLLARIFGRGQQYARLLERHPAAIERNWPVKPPGMKTTRAILMSEEFFDEQEIPF